MTQPTDAVRHAAALAHAVAGVSLRLRAPNGERLVVGRHPAADIGPCEWRRFVAAPASLRLARFRSAVDLERIEGVVRPLGGGAFGDRRTAGVRWLTTDLDQPEVVQVLQAADGEHRVHTGVDVGDVTAVIRPDVGLGVSVVRLEVAGPALGRDVDEMAVGVAANLLVAELEQALAATVAGTE